MTSSPRAARRPPAHFQELIERVEEATADPIYAQREEMWTRHNRLEKVAKVPVGVHLHGGYPLVWQELIPPDTLLATDPLERNVELQLRQKLYRHEHIPDDEVVLPTIWITAVPPRSDPDATRGSDPVVSLSRGAISGRDSQHGDGGEAARLWGLPFQLSETGDPGGAYKVEPVLHSDRDLELLREPRYQADEEATRALRDRATELVGGRLPVKVETDEIQASPSETMVSLIGIEAALFGVIDRPEFIHRLMDFITDGTIAYHRGREAAGAVDAEESWRFRTHYEELPPDADPHRLSSSWTYVSAQSMCGISPEMYAEFLQPYHSRLAAEMGEQRVYYHGCEDLTAKIPIIRQLPNLRRFHVSAWTDLASAAEQLGREFVLETHVHTADTLAVHTPEQMRQAFERIMADAGDCVFDINMGDIQTVYGDPSVLTRWAQIAQEVTARHA